MIGHMIWDAPRATSRHHRDDITFLVGLLWKDSFEPSFRTGAFQHLIFHQLDVDHESPNISNPPAIGNVESLDPLFW